MKICFFFHRFDGGGAEKTTIRLANELAAKGHEISIAVRYNYGPSKNLLNDEVRIIDLHLPERGKLVKNILNCLKLRDMMNSGKYDIVVAVMIEMAQVASIARFFSNDHTRLVCVLHNTVSAEKISFKKMRNRLIRFFDRQYDSIVAVSDAVRVDYLQKCFHSDKKTITIYNPVVDKNLVELSKIPPEHPWLERKRKWKILIMAGRLTYQKNYELIMKTLKILEKHGDYRLIILGEGELRQQLETKAKELGVHKKIDFLGYTDNPYSYISSGDCFVLTSHYEGLPTVLIEALACGSRIVSVDCPSGPREILSNREYGALVPVNDAEALAEAIISAINKIPDQDLLFKRAMNFSTEKSVKQYEELFYNLIAVDGR